MNKKNPSYNELKEKLAKTEELLARLQKSEINPIKNERDTAILSTKELAEAYLASEQNFKNSVDTCPLGIRIVTEDGELIYANKAALHIFGFKTVEELAAVKRQELFTPESYAAHQERKKKRKLKQYVPGEYELNIKRPDGQVRNLQVFRREVMWGGEKQFMTMYEDITERKGAEDALRESEEKYHSLIEHSNDGIIFIQEGLINYCNSKMLEMSGYTTEDLYGKSFVDFIVPEQKENVAEIYRKRIAGLIVPDKYELNLISKGGGIINTEISASLFYLRQKLVDIVIVRDITDRKKMDEALRQSEELFAKAFRASPDAVMITTFDEGIIIDVNDAAVKNTGYSINELVGHSVYEFNLWANPEDCEKMRNLLIKNDRVDREEYKFRTKSGEIRTWDFSAEPIIIAGRNCIISVQRDITERKQAEKALQESEEMFSLAFRDSPNLMVISTLKDGRLIEINDAYCHATGYSREELIGHSTLELNLWHDPEQRRAIIETLKNKEAVSNAEVKLRAKLGEIRTVFLSMSKITLKNEPCLISIAADITEQKQAEEALHKQQLFFEDVLANIQDGISILDNELNIIAVNKTIEQRAISTMPLAGKKCYEVFHGRTEPCEVCPTLQAMKNHNSTYNVVPRRAADGKIIGWFDLYSSPLIDRQTGEITGAIEYVRDITERKWAEEALKESEERYRLLFEKSKDAILLTSPDGGILVANPAACKTFGRSEEEICRLGRNGIIDASDPRLKEALEKRNSTGEFSGELTGIRADGTRFPIDVSSKVFYDREGKAKTSMIIRDISERKKMEEQLEADSEEIKLIIDSTPILVFYKDLEGKFLRVNKAFAVALNMTEEDMVGKTVFDLYSTNIAQGMTDDDQEVYKSGRSKLNIIEQYMSASGLRWVQTDKIPIFDKEGKVIGLVGFAQDITERKAAEEALKASEERLRSIFSAAPVGIGVAVNRVFTEVNENFCKMLGYTRDELIGQSARLVFPSDEEYEYVGSVKYKQLLLIGTSSMELRVRRKDDTVLNALVSASALDPNDLSRGVTFTTLDITERKRAEEALKESEEKFNKAFNASPNLMAVHTLEDGQIIDVNAAHTRITGYERREAIGKTVLELNLRADPEKREEFYKIMRTKDRIKDYELLLRTRSGEIRTLLFSAEKITLRGKNCIVVSGQDITERKEAEERINHLNLMLRSVRNVSQVITREKDRSLLIQKICDSLVESQSFKSVWIVLLDEKQQLTTWAGANMRKDFLALIEQIKQNKIPQCVKRAMKQRQVAITEDYEKMCKDCPINVEGPPHTGTMTARVEIEGKTYGVLCASIPQKKLIHDKEEIELFSEIAADIALALSNIDLVATNELQEQERLRMAKMESIGMLAGGIAHDFNNLLAGIMGNIGMVKTYIPPSDQTYEMLNEAEAAAVRARDLTQQLLTFAKGGKPVKKPISPAEIIKASAEFALRGSKAKLELSFPDDLWPLEADEGQITQVINNIVINADEAMPTGGTLKITAENVALKRSDALPVRGGNYVRINVKDTGIGISPAHLQRIFEPYFTTKKRGSGLGLTTAYSIVKNHGGIILVESVLNEGSTFHIYLPATKKALKGAKKLTVEESGQAGGKVLIMDDEAIIRKMLKNMLGLAGYAVELSADGAEALEKYKQAKEARDPFNAVIMDLTIPGGMGGKEAIKKILEMDPKATVIVSSGYATDPIMSAYKKYGFKAVIAKPYSVKQLRDLLSRLLAKKKR